MNPVGVAYDLKQFLTSCFKGCYWSAWILTKNADLFLDASSLNDLSPEEKMLLHKLTALNSSRRTELPAGHGLLKRDEVIHLSVFSTAWGKIVLASVPGCDAAVKVFTSLLPDLLNQWRLKSRLHQLIELNTVRLDESKRSEAESAVRIKDFVQFVMEDWKQKQSGPVSFSADLGEQFANSGPEEIVSQLNEALEIKRFLHPSGNFQITASDIQPPIEVKPSYTIISGNQRAEILLTKYEEAAERAFTQGEAINGKTVAAFLKPAVSPPAVTDALKKHRREIARLIHQYPERWKLVRQFLKPVRDLADRSFFE